MSDPNIHGLPRYIKPEIREVIRKRYCYGCVICGEGIIEYEHVDPEFANATEHNPDCMTLLCSTHNQMKRRKFLSIDAIKRAMETPAACSAGFSKQVLDVSAARLILKFAGSTYENVDIPIQVDGVPLIQILPPEDDGAPYRLSAKFYDFDGKNSLNIVENEWQASSENWDFEATAGRLIVREADKEECLILRVDNPGIIAVEKIKSKVNELAFFGDENQLTLVYPSGKELKVGTFSMKNAHIGLSLKGSF